MKRQTEKQPQPLPVPVAGCPRGGRAAAGGADPPPPPPKPIPKSSRGRIPPAAFAGRFLLKAGGETAGKRGGTGQGGGGCSGGRVGSARLGRAGGKLRTSPGKFQRKTKPDELFKGVSLAAPCRNFRSAFEIKIILVVVITITATTIITITIIIGNDGEKHLSPPEGSAGCSAAAQGSAGSGSGGSGTAPTFAACSAQVSC